MKWSELSVEQRERLISERVPKSKKNPWLHCHDIAEVGLWNRGDCCDSCHEDYEEYGYDYCLVFLPDGRVLNCCCSLYRWIEDAALDHKTVPQWVLDLEKSIEKGMVMKSEHEYHRDTRFQNFAKFLYPELKPLFRELFAAIYPLRDTNREKHAEDSIKLTLTRRAYDLLWHFKMYGTPVVTVPDIPEWPTYDDDGFPEWPDIEEEERILATDLSELDFPEEEDNENDD